MVWANPYTFEVLTHAVHLRSHTPPTYDVIRAWCVEHIGTLGKDWTAISAEMQFPHIWWFLNEDDAVKFSLVWG